MEKLGLFTFEQKSAKGNLIDLCKFKKSLENKGRLFQLLFANN